MGRLAVAIVLAYSLRLCAAQQVPDSSMPVGTPEAFITRQGACRGSSDKYGGHCWCGPLTSAAACFALRGNAVVAHYRADGNCDLLYLSQTAPTDCHAACAPREGTGTVIAYAPDISSGPDYALTSCLVPAIQQGACRAAGNKVGGHCSCGVQDSVAACFALRQAANAVEYQSDGSCNQMYLSPSAPTDCHGSCVPRLGDTAVLTYDADKSSKPQYSTYSCISPRSHLHEPQQGACRAADDKFGGYCQCDVQPYRDACFALIGTAAAVEYQPSGLCYLMFLSETAPTACSGACAISRPGSRTVTSYAADASSHQEYRKYWCSFTTETLMTPTSPTTTWSASPNPIRTPSQMPDPTTTTTTTTMTTTTTTTSLTQCLAGHDLTNNCKPCQPGFAGDGTGPCLHCGAGKEPFLDASTCVRCAEDKVSGPAEGECRSCEEGLRPNKDQMACHEAELIGSVSKNDLASLWIPIVGAVGTCLCTAGGCVYGFPRIRRWLRGVGFDPNDSV